MRYLIAHLYKIRLLYRSEFFIVSLLLIALLVIFFKEPIFNNKILAPTQILSNIMPFARDCGNHCPGVNFYWLDPVIAFNPWLKFQRDELQQGRLPLWNPWNGAGLPNLGNGSSAIFFPLHSLFYLFDFKFALLINAFLKLYLAGLFTYYYLRKLRLSPPASFFGAIAYMFCGFHVVWLSFAMTNISMLLPALFYLVERATEQKNSPQAYLLLALAWAIQFLVCHPQLSLVVISATSLYFIFKLGYLYRVQRRVYSVLQHGLAFGGAGLLGVSLAAIQLIPFTEYFLQSLVLVVRGSFEKNPYALPWNYAVLFVVPNLYGNPVDRWGGNYNETTMGYVGVFTLVLAIMAVLYRYDPQGRQLHFFFAGLVLWGAVLVYGLPPLFNLVTQLPLFKTITVNRFLVVIAFALAVLGAMGLERLVQAGRPNIIRLAISATPICLILTGIIINLPLPYVPPSFESYINHYVTLACLWTAAGILVVILRNLGKISFLVTVCLLTVLLWGDLVFTYGQHYQASSDPELFYPANPVLKFIQDHTTIERSTFTFNPSKPNFPPNLGLYYHIPDIRSYDAMGLLRYTQLFEQLGQLSYKTAWLEPTQDHNNRLFDLLNVKYVVVPANQKPGYGIDVVQDRNNTPVGELAGSYTVGQTFQATANNLTGIQLYMATFNRRNSEDIYFHLKTDPQSNKILRTVKIGAAQISDNSPLLFEFQPIPNSANQSYYFYIESPTSVSGNAFTFWGFDQDVYPGGNIFINTEPVIGDARFSVFYINEPGSMNYKQVYKDSGVKVYENTDRLPRSFIVGEAEVIKDDARLIAKLSQEDFNFRKWVLLEDEAALWPRAIVSQAAKLMVGQAIIQSYTPGEVQISTDSSINGYLVLTDNYYPGWQAFIDGQPRPIYRANYTFRAIQLPAGKHEVRFIYQPLSFRIGLWVTIFSLIGISALFIGILLKGRCLIPPFWTD